MIKINLLPKEFKGKRKQFKFNLSALWVCSSILALFLTLIFFTEMGNQIFNSKLKLKEREIERERKEIALYKNIEIKVKKLKEALKLLSDLEKKRISWPDIFNELSTCAPSQLQIQSLALSASKIPQVNLDGKASSRMEIAKFKEKLEASPLFSGTILGPTTQYTTEKGVFYTFSLTANLEKLGKEEKK